MTSYSKAYALADILRILHDTTLSQCIFQAYQGKHGNFIDQLEELNVPPYLFTRRCVEIPTISVDNGAQFNVTVKSRILTDVVGHIRQDRYVSFDT